MSSQPLVSIITPSYNQAAYLPAAIQSVLSQDYPKIEYLVIDGGSDDGSLEVVQRYADQLSYWVSEPDRGQAEAINKGLQRAQGEVVAWLNSDDLYRPGAVRSAVAALAAEPELAFVYGQLDSIDASGQTFNTIHYQPYTLADLLAFRIIGQPTVFFRRALLAGSGLLDPSYRYLLDHQLWLWLASQGPIRYVPQVWAAARHHPTAKNVAQASAFGQEVYRILTWVQSQPELAAIVAKQSRRVWGGAYRLDARYLLEGGQPAEALAAYWRALKSDPGYALKHWHRMLYALLSVLGLSSLLPELPGRRGA